MQDAMIDIETFATSTDAVVASIGAVVFDTNTGKPIRTLYINLRVTDQPYRAVDTDTLEWWANQSEAARARLLRPAPVSVEIGLKDLGKFLKGCQFVWANSPTFDLSILKDLYDDHGLDCPWHFRQEADYRTIKSLCRRAEVDLAELLDRPDVAHDALEDAAMQAKNLVKMLKAL